MRTTAKARGTTALFVFPIVALLAIAAPVARDESVRQVAATEFHPNLITISGSFNIGAGGNYPTLTAAVVDLNARVIVGPVVFNLTDSAYPSENFPIAITANIGSSAVNTVTIKPITGGIPTISGSNVTTLIDLNGCRFVTIDGFNGGTGGLMLRNTSSSGATVRLINDASNNTVKNTLVQGAVTSATSGVILFSTGATTGNLNNTISLNLISDRTDAAGVPSNLLCSTGTSAAIPNKNNTIFANQFKNFTASAIRMAASAGNENWTISDNLIFESAARTTALIGIHFASQGTNTITHNTIRDLNTSAAVTGMQFGDARTTTVSRNAISNIPSTSGSTGALIGINSIGSSGTAANVTVVNNFITIIPSFPNAQIVKGIQDDGLSGNTFTADFNTVLIGGTASGSSSSWAILRTTSSPSTYTMRNNIAFNNRMGGTGSHFAVGDQSANTGAFLSNFNFFAGTGATPASFMDYGTSAGGTAVSFATWKAGPPARDANSIANTAATFMVNTFFADVSNGDLHVRRTAPALLNPFENLGTPLVSLTTDADNDTRNSSTPDIGADEVMTMQFSAANFSVAENVGGGLATITVTRTAGAASFTTIDYLASNGTATGGASCGGSTDYVAAPIATLSFAPRQTSKTFNIPICNDSVFEADETVNLTLSSAIGDAIQGAPATAVLTITNDDPATTPTPPGTPTPTPTPTLTPTPTPTALNISGTAVYCSNPTLTPASGVTMTRTGASGGSTLTDGSGNYTFTGLTAGLSYTVTPSKAARTPGTSGINTSDSIAIQRHFLNLGTPLSGCRLAAADTNDPPNGVSTTDAIAVQRFFLGLTNGTAQSGRYKFTPASISYSPLIISQIGQNYGAVILGDCATAFVIPRPGGDPSQDVVGE